MSCVCIILARAGSKGLANKNVLDVAGRPMIAWTIDQALDARQRGVVDRVIVSTDGEAIAQIARNLNAEVLIRPAELAGDTATVDAAARHAVCEITDLESEIAQVVILYGNVPVRPDDLIDRAVAKLRQTGCDSVQSLCPVGKHHPYWMKRLDGDRLAPYEDSNVYRRQDLPPVYQLDGGIIAVTRRALFTVRDGEPHAFLGADRRAIVTQPGQVVDVDAASDLPRVEAAMFESTREAGGGTDPTPVMQIGGRRISRIERPYVIAELGVNHDGDVERAIELVDLAAGAGADAVKLQLFDPDLLLSAEAELAGYQRGVADDARAMLDGLRLSVEQMLAVKRRARGAGLGFVVTPFSIENLGAMIDLDPDAVKIASPDAVNRPLIEHMERLGKPMLISVGACHEGEIEPLRDLDPIGGLVLMQCVSAYPVPAGESGVTGIRSLHTHAGYSDHTTDLHTGMLATIFGAVVIEKHLTYDRSAAGPDHAASFDGEQFAEYVRLIGMAHTDLRDGDPFYREVKPCEQDVRRVSRQSVCAVRDLAAGTVIGRGDVTVKRPGTGIPAARLDQVVGQALTRDVKANHLLHDGDVELD